MSLKHDPKDQLCPSVSVDPALILTCVQRLVTKEINMTDLSCVIENFQIIQGLLSYVFMCYLFAQQVWELQEED